MQILYEISWPLSCCPIGTTYLSQLVTTTWKTSILCCRQDMNPIQRSRSFVIIALICLFCLNPLKRLSLKVCMK